MRPMRKKRALLSTLGFVWALNVGACAGPDGPGGANTGTGGSEANAGGDGMADAAGSSVQDASGTGGGTSGAPSAAGGRSLGTSGGRTGAGLGGNSAAEAAGESAGGAAGADSNASSGGPSNVLGSIGDPCLPAEELHPMFNGYSLSEVALDSGNPTCDSGLCVVNHFQGRVSCPYGQTTEQSGVAPECFVPGSNLGITVPVDPQRLARPAAQTVICSCRCDGPGAGPFCACPGDMTCAPLIQELGLPQNEDAVGSYCVPKGTVYDPLGTLPPEVCDAAVMNCGDPRPY